MIVSEKKFALLCTGGTGGHVTPAQALSQDLLSRGYRVEVVLDPRGQKFAPMFGSVPIHVIRSGTLGAGIWWKIKGLINLLIGMIQARFLINRLQPDIVIGFGGYPSYPMMKAAQDKRIPTIIHEQNAMIGRANKMLAKRAFRIALSLPLMGELDEEDKVRTIVTGNPVRPEIASLYNEPYPELSEDGMLRIFVTGGSLGASVFSKVLPEAFAKLDPAHRKRLYVVQQCRKDDVQAVRDAYEASKIEYRIETFFEDMADELRQAHLMIGRSGASTVAEVTTAGRPTIFVPYPHHKDQQQKMNAEALADAGGAWLMPESGFTADALLARIETFLQHPALLFEAAEKSRTHGKPDAARKLGNLVTAVVSGWN